MQNLWPSQQAAQIPLRGKGMNLILFREAKSQQPVCTVSLLLTDPLATKPPNF
jgi:hypothetical protein